MTTARNTSKSFTGCRRFPTCQREQSCVATGLICIPWVWWVLILTLPRSMHFNFFPLITASTSTTSTTIIQLTTVFTLVPNLSQNGYTTINRYPPGPEPSPFLSEYLTNRFVHTSNNWPDVHTPDVNDQTREEGGSYDDIR
jgi:hypothetical protein